MITGSDSIREVIAFPKTGGGGDPLTGAPTPITAQQRKEAGIDAEPRREDYQRPRTTRGPLVNGWSSRKPSAS